MSLDVSALQNDFVPLLILYGSVIQQAKIIHLNKQFFFQTIFHNLIEYVPIIFKMPRRGRSAPARAPPRASARAPAAPRPQAASQVPARAAPSQPMQAGASGQQPSMFKQMAATAGGVAMGSAIGHMAGAAMMGGSSGENTTQNHYQEAAASQQPMYNASEQQQPYGNQPTGPCAWEINQFLQCAQGQGAYDITLCEGFNEALRACKRANAYN